MTLRMTDGTFPSSVFVTIRVMKEFMEVMPSFYILFSLLGCIAPISTGLPYLESQEKGTTPFIGQLT